MEKKFSEFTFVERIDAYFEVLGQFPKTDSIKELLEEILKKYPNDEIVNYNRLQRDIKKFVNEKQIISTTPIEALKYWKRRFYLSVSNQDYIIANALDMIFDSPKLYIKTPPYEAERMGHRLREIYADLKPFVIADYDTVLMTFSSQTKYDKFKERFNAYLEFEPDEEEEEN